MNMHVYITLMGTIINQSIQSISFNEGKNKLELKNSACKL